MTSPRRRPPSERARTVLVTTPRLAPEEGDGDAYALNICRRLARDHGWRVAVVISSDRGGWPTSAGDEDGLHVYRLPGLAPTPRTRPGAAWRKHLGGILALERPGLVNAHAPVPGLAPLVARVPTVRVPTVPVVVTWHQGGERIGDAPPATDITGYEGIRRRRLLSRAAWVISTSDLLRDSVLAPVRAKCTTVPPGVDTERFTPAPVRDINRVVFVGGLNRGDAEGGLVEVLHATAHLARSRASLTLDVVGAGSERTACEALAEALGLRDRTRFHGHLTGDGLVDTLRGAAMLVLPTTSASFPSVLVEAMACGLPVVATAAGDVAGMIVEDRTGHLVAAGAGALLAQRVGELLDDPARADAMGAAARRKVLTSLSWDAQAARTNDLFGEVLAGRSPSGRRNLAVVAPFFPPKVGGLEHYAQEIARGLVGLGEWDVTVFTANHAARRTTVEVSDAMTVHRLRPWLSVSNTPVNPMWFWYLRRAFAANRIDAVHAHTPVPFLSDIAAMAAGSRPLIVTYHAGSMIKGRQPVDGVIRRYERAILPRLLRRADALVAVSASVASRFFTEYPEKTSVLSPGVDAARFVPAPTSSAQGPPTVLYVGKIATSAQWKGLAQLFDAFTLIVEQVPEARLVLVGGGDAVGSYLERAERAGVRESVDLAGELGGDDLVSAYQMASVVVLPSLTEAESFGMSLIEAMACAKPVVGSRIGGIPFVIDDGVTGLLVPPGDAKALAGACLRLLTDRQTAGAMGAKGRKMVVADYTWTDRVDRYAALLRAGMVDRAHEKPDNGQPRSGRKAVRPTG
ncbi:MAG: glycosyltransferase family 4 protein [Acidimicrobiales bacterium]